MADKQIIIEEQRSLQNAPVDVHSEQFEKAYFTNSYPQESSKVKSLITCIKIVSIGAIIYELLVGVSLGSAVYEYS